MKLSIGKSKNTEHLYVSKSYRNSKGKSSTKTIKKLGRMQDLLPMFDNDRDKVIAWAKEEARKMTIAEKESRIDVVIKFSESKKPPKDKQLRFNCGYLHLSKIYHELGLNKICKDIESQGNSKFDLSEILEVLVYSRIIEPSSKRSSFKTAESFLKDKSFDLHHIYRSLDMLAEHSEDIQSQLYLNSINVVDRNNHILYYDCTNYYFEIEEEKGFRKYGKSKENRPNPIVNMGLFMDGNGIPLAFTVFPGNQNEQPSLKPLEKKIIKDFNLSKFVVCTDAGLASTSNRQFNNFSGRSFIVTQSLKKLKSYIKEWALSPTDWHLSGSDKTFNIEELDEESDYEKVFFKETWINENGIEQRLIVSYSLKYKEYQRSIRDRQVERAARVIEKGKSASTRNPNSPLRFVEELAVTTQGEVADKKSISLNEEKIEKEEMFDGFYAVCTTLEDDCKEILKINHQRWQIEAAFKTMKTEFKARPVYLQRDDRIEAHFLTCFIALLILKILQKRLKHEFTGTEIIKTLRDMYLHKVEGFGYINSYTRTELTDKLNENTNINLDSEFITDKSMKKILRTIKQG